MTTPDPIIRRLIAQLDARSSTGFVKYGVGLDRQDLPIEEWLEHLQNELLDAAGYIERLKDELTVLRVVAHQMRRGVKPNLGKQ